VLSRVLVVTYPSLFFSLSLPAPSFSFPLPTPQSTMERHELFQ
jgi:hypothetical protein